MPLLVKICGINSAEAMDAALDAGADMVGLVFFAKSPRHVSLSQAKRLADMARGRAEIAVLTVDPEDDLVATITDTLRPDWLQLHGEESPERTMQLRQTFGLPIMKACGIATVADLGRAGIYAGVADRLLIDAEAPAGALRPGGNGLPFDWGLMVGFDLKTPFMLSGGLRTESVGEAIALLDSIRGFVGVDVSSGVEHAPGVKDPARIRAFIAAVREGRVAEEEAVA